MLSILILLAGIGGYIVMPKDVLPEVNIPVVYNRLDIYAGDGKVRYHLH